MEKSNVPGLILKPQSEKLIAEIYQDGDQVKMHPKIPIPFLALADMLTGLANAYIKMEIQIQQSNLTVVPAMSALGLSSNKGNGG